MHNAILAILFEFSHGAPSAVYVAMSLTPTRWTVRKRSLIDLDDELPPVSYEVAFVVAMEGEKISESEANQVFPAIAEQYRYN